MVCDPHFCFQNILSTPGGKLHTHGAVNAPLHAPPQPLAASDLLSICMDLPALAIS